MGQEPQAATAATASSHSRAAAAGCAHAERRRPQTTCCLRVAAIRRLSPGLRKQIFCTSVIPPGRSSSCQSKPNTDRLISLNPPPSPPSLLAQMTYSSHSSASFPPAYTPRYSFNDQYSKHSYPAPAAHHQQHHPHHHHIPVKLEESPDLPPAPSAAHHHQHQHSNHPHHEHRHHKSQDAPLFRFGSDFGSSASPTSPAAPFTFMSQQWPGPAAAPSASSASGYAAHAHAHTQYAVDRAHYALPSSLNGHHAAMELNDDYDDPDGDELADLPSATLGGLSLPAYGSQAGTSLHGDGAGTKGEKQIRRRSSKACDQCRKSKCKCERGSPQDPCRNCVMLGTRESPLGSMLDAARRLPPAVGMPALYRCAVILTIRNSVHIPGPVAQAWPAKGLHRRDRGTAPSNGGAHRYPAREQGQSCTQRARRHQRGECRPISRPGR